MKRMDCFLLGTLCLIGLGCGTTRTTNTSRTAIEQVLVSDAVDRSLDKMDFTSLAGIAVFLDTAPVQTAVDKEYLISAVREKLTQEGALLQEKIEEADVVAELRAGALGTNNHEWFIGVPEVSASGGSVPLPAFIPEIPVIKRTKQEGMAKIQVFTYDRQTKQFLAKSDARFATSLDDSLWVFGMGPYERGSARERIKTAEDPAPGAKLAKKAPAEPKKLAGKKEKATGTKKK